MRMAMLFAGTLGLACGAEAPETPTRAATIADHRVLAAAEALPVAVRGQVRELRMAVAIPGRDQQLTRGLFELGAGDPSLAIRVVQNPNPKNIRGGYLGTREVGKAARVDARMEGAADWLQARQMADDLQFAGIFLHAEDLPSGRTIEVPVTTYQGLFEIDFTSAGLAGSFTEQIQAPRIFTGPNGRQVVTPAVNYPLELPNVGVNHIHTVVGMGLGTPGAIPGPNAPAEPLHAARDPRVAWEDYRVAMEALERAHPRLRIAWTTMPLLATRNPQRTWFNLQVRAYAKSHGKLLFDGAALTSRDGQGVVQLTRDGEEIANEWRDPERPSQLNPAGRRRLALAWIWLAAQAGGFGNAPLSTTAASGS